MKLAVIGTGYVGLVAGAGFAETGNDVICADIDDGKIAILKAGGMPIYEPGLEVLVENNVKAGRLSFSTDVSHAVSSSDIVFIAVGTPPGEDGSADLQHVLEVARTIGKSMNGETIVATKSTVPVGTAIKVKEVIQQETDFSVHVCSNPEFLKEGAAVEDFMKPDRIILGVDSEFAGNLLSELHAPFVRSGNSIQIMDVASAEITKYASNAMLATRISFMNSIAQLCENAGADVDMVRRGMGSDSRIGPSFLYPGVGYGGSCFPKDVKALIRTMRGFGTNAQVLEAVEAVNENQKKFLARKVVERFGKDLKGRLFGVWGLSFKPNTDDMREAPSLVTIPALLERGAAVIAHDPVAMEEARRHFGDSIAYADLNYGVLDGADALIIHTEWLPYRRPDFQRMKELLKTPIIFDGRNLYRPEKMEELGFEHYSVGRRQVHPERK